MLTGTELRTTPAKGDGMFTTRAFTAGETVMVGRIEHRVDSNHAHASQLGEHEFGLHAGLISKFNHSCEPNCGIHLNAGGGHDFVAMRDLVVGEEATFDYAMRNYRIEHFPDMCGCGAVACRGTITGWRSLPQDRKDTYAGFVAPYLIAMDAALTVPAKVLEELT